MAVPFPVARDVLPQVHVTDNERDNRREQMQRMLESLVHDYERYTEGTTRTVDARRWKPSTSRDHVKLYKERSSYLREQQQQQGIDGPFGDEGRGIDDQRMSLVVGECAGRMENALYAVVAADQSELAMVDIFLHEDVADCAILATMEGATRDDPYHFLGYKWFVRKSPTSSHLVKHRDSVYVEYTGLTKTQMGEQLGFHIMHSVELADFPRIRGRNCVRTLQSIRTIYRQRPGNVVEVFMIGNVDLAGSIKGRLAEVFVNETLFNLLRLVECGEAKRLADMARDLRDMREDRVMSKRHAGESCGLCRHPKKRFGPAIDECNVCGIDVCAKCRISKRLFHSDGVLGRFQKIVSCKTCLLVVANAKTHGRDLVLSSASTSDESSAPSSPVSAVSSPRRAGPTLTAQALEMRNRAVSAGSAISSLRSSLDSGHDLTLPESPRVIVYEEEDDAEQVQRHPGRNGPTTTYRDQVIDISGSLAFLNNENTTAPSPSSPRSPPAHVDVVRPAPTGPVTTYRNQVIDISGSLGLRTEERAAVPMPEPLYDEAASPTPPPTRVTLLESPPASASVAAASPPPASSPATQAELYMKMLELQKKAQDAYNTTRQNQQYVLGQSPE